MSQVVHGTFLIPTAFYILEVYVKTVHYFNLFHTYYIFMQ